MKLELKHLAPYLPYGLQVNANNSDLHIENFTGEISSWEYYNTRFNVWNEYKIKSHMVSIESIKPILRPISSMTKEEACEFGVLLIGKVDMEDKKVRVGDMELMGDTYPTIMYQDQEDDDYSVMVQFSSTGISVSVVDLMPYVAYEWLFKNHFDVFDLIGNNLAIEKRDEQF